MLRLGGIGAKVEYFYINTGPSLKYLRSLGFLIMTVPTGYYPGYYFLGVIVPAPYVDMDALKLFEEPRRVGAASAERVESAVTPRFADVKPSREVLEGTVAEVLRSLSFSSQTNVRLPAKGGDIEVDVWAVKSVGGAQFRVYVSCKNWDKDVDRQVVGQEFGRVP